MAVGLLHGQLGSRWRDGRAGVRSTASLNAGDCKWSVTGAWSVADVTLP